ncbi:pilus assembly protein [bacterium]|nr:pilus assembly protein [bacterium]
MSTSREEGAALVEFALILPIFIIVVFGIIGFGRAYQTKIAVTHAAREGVRELAVSRDTGLAATVAVGAADTLDPGSVAVSTSSCEPGSPASVTVSYPMTVSIPLLGSHTLMVESTAVMRCGG